MEAGTSVGKKEKRFDPSWKWWGEIDENRKIGIPAFLAALYFLCMPLSIVSFGGISLLKAVSYLLGLTLTVKLFVGKSRLRLNSMHLFLGVYLVYSIFSWFLVRSETAFAVVRGLMETSLVFVLITANIYNEREGEMLYNCWFLIGIFTMVNVLLGQLLGESSGTGRVTMMLGGAEEDPNQLCGYFIFPMLCCFRKLKKGQWLKNALYIALLVLMGYCVLLTGSRGGLLAVGGGLAVYIILAVPGWKNRLKTGIAMALAAAMFWFVVMPLLPQETQERFTLERIEEDKGSGRFVIWEAIADAMVVEDFSMLFGYGFGATEKIIATTGRVNTVAHNHWMQLWADQGLVGVAIFGIFFAFAFIRNLRDRRFVSVAVLGMLVLSMSLTMYATYKPFWNFLMVAALSIENVPKEERHACESQLHSSGL